MRKIIALLACVLTIYGTNAQSLTISYVQIYAKTNAIVPVVNGWNGPDGTSPTIGFSYEQFFSHKKHSITASFIKFKGCTLIYFEPGGVIAGGGEILAEGFCDGVNVNRFDLGFSYLLTKWRKKFYFKPFAGMGFQWTRKTGADYWNTGLPIVGPSYFELEPLIAEPMNTSQIVPLLGLRTGFVFWKRLDVGITFQGVYAFKAFQKMSLKYQYKGAVQPTATYESTGTGLFVSLGMGYRFAKLIK
jgi:hypothetical protein